MIDAILKNRPLYFSQEDIVDSIGWHHGWHATTIPSAQVFHIVLQDAACSTFQLLLLRHYWRPRLGAQLALPLLWLDGADGVVERFWGKGLPVGPVDGHGV